MTGFQNILTLYRENATTLLIVIVFIFTFSNNYICKILPLS
uniref:Uncharacterized protein n=1 Tax=Arundo donax TaxID=35708 RepID=A0A0A9GL18_ARUDO